MTALNLVSLSASPHEPSKTTALLDAVVTELGRRLDLADRRILISDIAPELGSALSRQNVGPRAAEALKDVEASDLLVVSTPTYRASYTGMFKHFFDFIGQDALAGKPVFLSSIGGNASHSLSIDHQLRPLFAFFRAVSLPVGVFAENVDFDHYTASENLRARITSAVDEALPIIGARVDGARR
ncbi:MAG: msuE [Microbacteriaceae bacterium]|nr:msuE [Microbacteriaceae bacterium]